MRTLLKPPPPTLLMQLANISLRTGATLDIDPSKGRILGNPEARHYWPRDYEPGWEPKVWQKQIPSKK